MRKRKTEINSEAAQTQTGADNRAQAGAGAGFQGRHGGAGRGRGRGPQDAKKTMKRLMSYVLDYKGTLAVVLPCILLSSMGSVVAAMFLQILIDGFIVPLMGKANPDYSALAQMLTLIAGLLAISALATLVYTRLMVNISQGTLKRIRDKMFAHMQRLPIRYFDTHTHGDIMSRYTNDTDTLRQVISQTVPQFFSSAVTVIVVLAAMVFTSIPLTLLTLLFAALMLWSAMAIGGKSGKYFMKQQNALGAVNGYIEEMINGQKVVKVFCHEEEAKKEFDTLNEDLQKNAATANSLANIIIPLTANLGNLQYVVLAIAGGAIAILGNGGLTLGMIAAFLQLARSFAMPLNQVAQQVTSIVMALAGAERIFMLMDEEPEQDDGVAQLVNARRLPDGRLQETEDHTGVWAWKYPKENGLVDYIELKGDVRFFDVDFGYEPEKEILHGISLFAKPGHKLAFVGATGAGKTTITNLINRFYDVESGTITYDGIDIRRIRKPDLRESLGMVLQDVHLFTGTVMENIRYGNPQATDEAVVEAAKLANAHGFIERLPEGYQTVLDADGSNLSQGQRQLLSIARAAVADPPVMILDEATSSIDTHTEAIVQKGMDALMNGRTVFVIAHRLSTVQNSNAILVLEDGRIIERGDHQALIQEKGKYYQLYTGAFELE